MKSITNWQKTGRVLRFYEERTDETSKIWLIVRNGEVINTTPPNLGTLTKEEAAGYAQKRYGKEARVKAHHSATIQWVEEL